MPPAGRFSRRCATTRRMRAAIGLALGLLLLAGSTAVSGVGPFPPGAAWSGQGGPPSVSWAGPKATGDTAGSALARARVRAFVAAYGRGDVAGVRALPSPVFELELERRGFDLGAYVAATAPRTLRFADRAILRDPAGYGHVFCTSRSTSGSPPDNLMVWRIDVDPAGWVLWAEPIYLFSADRAVIVAWHPVTPVPFRQVGTAVLGVHLLGGAEGLYVVENPGPARPLLFLVIHDDGAASVAAWGFGDSQAEAAPFGQQERWQQRADALLRLGVLFKDAAVPAYQRYARSLG